jgi:glucoamylase
VGTPTGEAPGRPGIAPRWTSSAKSGAGAATSGVSRVWFTLSHGILDEVYYPRLDQACTRDLGLLVADGQGFVSEEKRHTRSTVRCVAPGVPAYRLDNVCVEGRYRIEKVVTADPRRDAVLQRVRFVPLAGATAGTASGGAVGEASGGYRLYALLAPHLGNGGWGNTAWVGDYKGVPMLFAERDGIALALACSVPWLRRSAGFVGASDGWQDLARHGVMTWEYASAGGGNVALTGEVDLAGATDGTVVLALAFGTGGAEAGQRALASLQDGFDGALERCVREWREWQDRLIPLEPQAEGGAAGAPEGAGGGLYRVSTAVLGTHEALHAPGGIIASLSIPWGDARTDDDLGGYHLVWPRDLAEAAGGLLAAGAHGAARRVLGYLEVTQEPDGHWPQCMWLDGRPYWTGIQLDETALPILLVDLALREGALSPADLVRYWPMVRRAAGFLVRRGPVTEEDRWEEDAGFSPFTLGAMVAALLAAADLGAGQGEAGVATYLRETADAWNDRIERWTYVAGTDLATRLGAEGYYVRIAPPGAPDGAPPARGAWSVQGLVPLKNRPPGEGEAPAAQVVSPDALALVRFGLRAPDDPRVVSTVRVVDALLEVETPTGPAWRRYTEDGYGEHADGAPFDGTGVGRAWPLLTGERAHYELAAGRLEVAESLRRAMESFAGPGGLLPEQIWDAPDVPERELFFGRPSGSAMPLVWAHAEYVKLLRSLRDGRVFDQPPQPVQRYQVERTGSGHSVWRFNLKGRAAPAGTTLRLETLAPARVHWSGDGWRTVTDTPTTDTGLGVYLADVPTAGLPAGSTVVFTFFWPEAGRWEGQDFAVALVEP